DAHVLASVAHERRLGAHPDEALPILDRAIAADGDYVVPRIERALLLDSIPMSLAANHELEVAAARAPRPPGLLRVRVAIAERAQLPDLALQLRREYLGVVANDLGA